MKKRKDDLQKFEELARRTQLRKDRRKLAIREALLSAITAAERTGLCGTEGVELFIVGYLIGSAAINDADNTLLTARFGALRKRHAEQAIIEKNAQAIESLGAVMRAARDRK